MTDPDVNPNADEFWSRAMEKKLADRLQIVLEDPYLLKLFQQFGGRIFRRSSVFHGLAAFLRLNGIKGRTAFEIGTWNGLTAIILSRHFEKVVTCDIANEKLKYRLVDHLGIKNIEFVTVEDNSAKAKLARSTDFDFAYVDGDHAHDTAHDFDLVRKCRQVMFQEVWPFQEPVWELVEALPQSQIIRGGDGLALWDGNRPIPKVK